MIIDDSSFSPLIAWTIILMIFTLGSIVFVYAFKIVYTALYYLNRLHKGHNLKNGWVYLDVGASWGSYVIPSSRQVGPEGLVIAIEPNPKSYRELNEIVKYLHLENVMTYGVAAWNEDTDIKLYLGKKAALSSVKTEYQTDRVINVMAVRMDTLIGELDLTVDALKVDVEGAEVEVLDGAREILKTVQWVTVELHGEPGIREKRSIAVQNHLASVGLTVMAGRKHVKGIRK